MKKILIALISVFVLSTAFAQSNATVSMCNAAVKSEKVNTATLTLEELLKCNQLASIDKTHYIQSFTFSIKTANKTVHEIKTDGNKLTEKMIALIKEHKPEKIYLEDIVVINQAGEAINTKALILTIK
mgnify:CR=1 FL=1